MRQRIWAVVLLGSVLVAPSAWASTWKIDQEHTTVAFKVRHLFSKVQGEFKQFEGTFDYEPGKPEAWKANATIQASSIDTNVAERDKHLRSKDFFDVDQYPTLTFTSTGVRDVSQTGAKLDGLLTIHGVQKPVTLDLEVHGAGKDPWGNVRSGFTAKTTINRKDFGLTWNMAVETGQLLVGEEAEIILEVEGIAAE